MISNILYIYVEMAFLCLSLLLLFLLKETGVFKGIKMYKEEYL